MALRVAINGFGRIGRLVARKILQSEGIELIAVNDLVPANNLAYLLKYDSLHGIFNNVSDLEDGIMVNNHKIFVFNEKDPQLLPWKDLNIDIVIESTGHFTSHDTAEVHLKAGAKKVIITAPAKGNVPTFVMGVNHTDYDPNAHHILSNASCTTNCLAPIAKIIDDAFGIDEALMTTVHATTASQPTVDGPSKKDWRGGRSAMTNIIPASTGAAQAVTLCLPHLKGKLTGMALRVPVADVSVVDLTVKTSNSTSYEQICQAMKDASNSSFKGIVSYCEELLVSSDFIGSPYSAIFDKDAGIALNDRFFKIVAWYDNEMGYSCRVVDLARWIGSFLSN